MNFLGFGNFAKKSNKKEPEKESSEGKQYIHYVYINV